MQPTQDKPSSQENAAWRASWRLDEPTQKSKSLRSSVNAKRGLAESLNEEEAEAAASSCGLHGIHDRPSVVLAKAGKEGDPAGPLTAEAGEWLKALPSPWAGKGGRMPAGPVQAALLPASSIGVQQGNSKAAGSQERSGTCLFDAGQDGLGSHTKRGLSNPDGSQAPVGTTDIPAQQDSPEASVKGSSELDQGASRPAVAQKEHGRKAEGDQISDAATQFGQPSRGTRQAGSKTLEAALKAASPPTQRTSLSLPRRRPILQDRQDGNLQQRSFMDISDKAPLEKAGSWRVRQQFLRPGDRYGLADEPLGLQNPGLDTDDSARPSIDAAQRANASPRSYNIGAGMSSARVAGEAHREAGPDIDMLIAKAEKMRLEMDSVLQLHQRFREQALAIEGEKT